MFNIFEHEALKKYLDDQAKEGWICTYFGKTLLKFEKSDQLVHYGVDAFGKSKEEKDYYDDLVESLGWQKIGEYNGMRVFKNNSNEEFFTDDEQDQKHLKKMILRKMLKNMIFNIGLLLILIYMILFSRTFTRDFISNNMITFYIDYFLLFIAHIITRYIPDIRYLMGKGETNYHKIEIRSWICIFGIFALLLNVLLINYFAVSYVQNDFLLFTSIYWICILTLGIICYFIRNSFNKIIDFIFISFGVICMSCFIVILSDKPLYRLLDEIQNNKDFISTDIPLSIYENKSNSKVKMNSIDESLIMKKQEVLEEWNDEGFLYHYYVVKNDYLNDYIFDKVKKSWDMIEMKKKDDVELTYDKSINPARLFVRKENEAYLFWIHDLSKSEVNNIIQLIEWHN